jgi:DNA-binding CsgD family transcriptional regulator
LLPRAEREPTLRELATYYRACALVLCGRCQEALPTLKHFEQALEEGSPFANPFLSISLPHAYVWIDEMVERGRALLFGTVQRARREGALVALPHALACLALADWRLGNWPAAYAAAAESAALAEDTGQVSELGNSLVTLARVEAGLGHTAACREHVERAQEIGQRLQIGGIFAVGGGVLGLLELSLGRLEAAVERLEATGRYALGRGLEEPMVVPWAQDLAEAYIRVGDRGSAERTLATLDAQAERTGGRQAAAAVARCRGLLEADEARAEVWFARALDLHEQRPDPFERARTELCHGERLRRARHRADAREPLRDALEAFERLGAEPWAQRARRELAATGEQVRGQRQLVARELTPQELQVALAVANGASNREAAAALFVSPKTIEAQLTSIYRKLDIRSRTQLAKAMHEDALALTG